MKVIKVSPKGFGANTYLITADGKNAVVIDPSGAHVARECERLQLVPAYDLPSDFIVGTTGAGDAFCAGALLGIYQGKSDKEILEFASASAVAALSSADATSGLRTEQEINELCKSLKRKEICL